MQVPLRSTNRVSVILMFSDECEYGLLTMSQTSNDDDCLDSSFDLVASGQRRLAMLRASSSVLFPSLPYTIDSIDDPYQRYKDSLTDPKPFVLFVANNLIFQCTQRSELAGGRCRAPEL